MEILTSPQAWLTALGIFSLRVISISLDTVRVIFVVSGKKLLTWILGFISSLILVIALGSVLAQLNNPLNIIGYAAGMATGNVLGILLEQKLAIGHIHLTIFSSSLGPAIAEKVRNDGFAVTEIPAQGKNGMVSMLYCDVLRKDVNHIESVTREIDSSAFITAEEIRPVQHGFWRK